MFLPVILVFSFFLTITGSSGNPPETWKENWYEHNQLLTKFYQDNDVVIYFDSDVHKTINWLKTYFRDFWVYVKRNYGNFGDDPLLYGIFHSAKYVGCHSTTYFNKQKSYRNVIDCGLPDEDAWTFGTKNERNLIARSINFIVQGASHGVEGYGAHAISNHNFDDIIVYDLFSGINQTADAVRWYEDHINKHEKVKGKEVYWFKDWFLKIYKKYGKGKVINRFLELLAEHFPKTNTASLNRPKYERNMTWGEFFHFWNAATGTNLKSVAGQVFGWSDEFEEEFKNATTQFPELTKLYDVPDENKTAE